MNGIATAVGTLIIVVLILYLTFIITRYIAKSAGFKSASKNMKVIDSLSLGRSTLIAIVEIGSRYYLIGSGEQSVSMLGEISPEEAHLMILENQFKEKTSSKPFRDMLDRFRKNKDDNGKED